MTQQCPLKLMDIQIEAKYDVFLWSKNSKLSLKTLSNVPKIEILNHLIWTRNKNHLLYYKGKLV